MVVWVKKAFLDNRLDRTVTETRAEHRKRGGPGRTNTFAGRRLLVRLPHRDADDDADDGKDDDDQDRLLDVLAEEVTLHTHNTTERRTR